MDSILNDPQADARDAISDYLKERGISRTWLANKIFINQSSLSRILNKDRDLTSPTLDKINEALQTDFKL